MLTGLDFPPDLHYLIEHQVWARIDADARHATVGITSLGMKLAGEVYMCRPKSVGSVVEQGRSVAVVELAKSIVSVKSPVGGTVVEVNARLAEQPELLQSAPYGDGWIARIALAGLDADRAQLLHGTDAVVPAMERHAWLHNLESSS